jgi:hypothetical protein
VSSFFAQMIQRRDLTLPQDDGSFSFSGAFFFEFDRGVTGSTQQSITRQSCAGAAVCCGVACTDTEIKWRSWGLARRKVSGNWQGQLHLLSAVQIKSPLLFYSLHGHCMPSKRVSILSCPQENLQKMPWQVTGHAATDPAL